ncbi:putative glycerophosphoryl diester phosphodiesterase 1 [Gimesia panareensis]|uniref:Putative glycerophosphoryl diester phosphodiesterase 1 n=1 Tax=Gimesia panareensis TaxID=2527978 RepID=A0A518FS13_9PLAN|nr:glycerophosphodiester phosphodiesterase family protein [Gimesia panareensis]QDV19124.1 putative glycerophosphoryl diester phosphodiesterase 1 [Gimesia panareensis]
MKLKFRLLMILLLLLCVPIPVSAQTDATTQTRFQQRGLKNPKQGGLYVVAHRGAHQGIPENSLAAYKKAIELGADFVEIDIRKTKDGKYVSIHNATIDKYVTGKTGKVEEMTLAELKALDIGTRVSPEWEGTRIPTFEEILKLCKGKIGIYLDLKRGNVDELVKIIRQHGMEREILWYAWPQDLNRLQQVCPNCIAMPDPILEINLPNTIKQFHPTVIASTWKRYSQKFVETCHQANALVIVDESDPGCWKEAIAWGSDGIQTDHPAKLIEYLKQNQVPRP